MSRVQRVAQKIFLLSFFSTLIIFRPLFLFAAAEESTAASSSSSRASTDESVAIKADQLEYYDTLGKVVASGNVVATYKEVKLTCDKATIYTKTKDAYLNGRVHLFQNSGLLTGDEVVYNFETRKGIAFDSGGIMGPWRTSGEEALKVAGTEYLQQNGYLTSCDFEEPHTRIKAREANIFMDDQVLFKNAVMYIGNTPVFYLPSYMYPLDDKRPRVSIVPGSDKIWGYFALTSWKLYFTEKIQGRLNVDFREKFGLAWGPDLNYELPVGGYGLFRAYYTDAEIIQRKHLWGKWINAKKGRSKITVEKERFRIQVRHRLEIDPETNATLEYSVQKDPAFLKDYYRQEYLQEQNTSSGTFLEISRLVPWYGLNFLVTKRVNKYEAATQQWPSISWDLRPIAIPFLPVLGRRITSSAYSDEEMKRMDSRSFKQSKITSTGWEYQSSYTYAHSNELTPTEGTKNSFHVGTSRQELAYPMRLLRFLNFRSLVAFGERVASRSAERIGVQSRQDISTGFDLNTRFFRVFLLDTNFLGLNIHKLRHIVSPSFSYRYQAKPTIPASALFQGDGLAKSNSLGPSIEQKLQTKRMVQGGEELVDLARFTTSMPYDLEGSGGRGGVWGNTTLDLEMQPYPWMYTESNMTIDPHVGKVTTINADLTMHQPLKGEQSNVPIVNRVNSDVAPRDELDLTQGLQQYPWTFGLGWRYTRNSSAMMSTEVGVNLGKKWRMELYQGFDVKRFVTETTVNGPKTVKKIYDVPEFEYRIFRDLHEWTFELIYGHQRSQGNTLYFIFRLKGAPDLPLEYNRHYHKPKAGRNFPKV